MSDFSSNPRIASLIEQAEAAVTLLAQTEARGGSVSDIRETLDTVYRDLGKAVHSLARQRRSLHGGGATNLLPDEITETEEMNASELTPLSRDAWYTDEVDRQGDGSSGSLFDFGPRDDATDVPESDPLLEDADNANDVVALNLAHHLPLGPSITLTELAANADANDASGLAQLSRTREPPHWRDALHELLDLLTLPASGSDGLAIEASKVQWATTDLNIKLADFPADVQTAMIGLLATRARHLRDHAEVDVGPQHALARLKRFTATHDLRAPTALLDDHAPSGDTWLAEAYGWWALLDPTDESAQR